MEKVSKRDYEALMSYLKDGVLTIPKEVKTIDGEIHDFITKQKVKELQFESGSELEEIKNNAFSQCESITKVDLSNCPKLKRIGRFAFWQIRNLTDVNLANCVNLEHIDLGAFEECGLKKLDLSTLVNLVTIGRFAFGTCKDLREVTFPKNGEKDAQLKNIENFGFIYSALEKVDLSNLHNLVELGYRSFGENKKLKTFVMRNCENFVDFTNAVTNCTLDSIDFENTNNITFREFILTKKIKFSSNFHGANTIVIKDMFSIDGGTDIEVVGGKSPWVIKSNSEEFGNFNLSTIHIMQVLGNKAKYVAPVFFNVCTCEEQVKVMLKNYAMLKKLYTDLFEKNELLKIVNTIVSETEEQLNQEELKNYELEVLNKQTINLMKLIKALGFYGFNDVDFVINKGDIEAYKGLLAKDYVYGKIKNNIKTDINKDYVNRIISEKVNKVSKTKSLQELVFAFIENNIVGYKDFDKLMYEIDSVNLTDKPSIKLIQFLVANMEQIKNEVIANSKYIDEENEDFDDSEELRINLSVLISNFNNILLNNPNKMVVSRQNNQRLTLNDCQFECAYQGILQGNGELAALCARCHLTQREYEELQKLYEDSKQVKGDKILQAGKDDESKEITYNVLAKSDPLGLVLGNITNCCQKIYGAGYDCMRKGVLEPTSSFAVFYHEGKIIGQSWLWYNEETKTVALDNIEIPDIYNKLVNKEKSKEMLDCIQRLCDNIFKTMNEKGFKVENVVIGKHCTDVNALISIYPLNNDDDDKFMVPYSMNGSDFPIYSDSIIDGTYVVYENGKKAVLNPKKNSVQETLTISA